MTIEKENGLLKELKDNIRSGDPIKARVVLTHIGEVDRRTRMLVLAELAGAEDEFAIPLLAETLAAQPELADEFPALRETLYSKVIERPEVLLNLLAKKNGIRTRAILAEVAGELRMMEAAPVLTNLLTRETEPELLRAAVRALGTIGDRSTASAVAEYLYAEDMDLISSAIWALGQMASPTAVQRLAERVGLNPELDDMILDVFADLQTPEAFERLNESLGSHYAHIRNTAKRNMARIGPKVLPTLMKNLKENDPDLLIHSLNVMGDVGDEAAVGPIRELLHNEPKDANVRFAAYETLGRLPLDKRAYALAAGLHDPVGNVRSAAASAIDRNFSIVLAAGVKNMIRPEDAEARNIVLTVIDSLCDNIFTALIDDNYFRTTALSYLKNETHAEVREHYAVLLAQKGKPDLAAELGVATAEMAGAKPLVYAVDDSPVILKIYRRVLHALGCESLLFERAEEAIARIETARPALILTDLNMPKVTGIDLAERVRRLYDRRELPIVMITTQNEMTDNEAAWHVGVNTILNKPFTQEDIGQVLVEYGIIGPNVEAG